MSASGLRYTNSLLPQQLFLPFRYQNSKMQTPTIAKTKSSPLIPALPRLSPTDLKIISLLARYRFINSSFIPLLIQATTTTSLVRERLFRLSQNNYVNRFRPSPKDQFIYYLDNPASIDQLQRDPAYFPSGFKPGSLKSTIRGHRRRDYATAIQRRAWGQLDKVEHTLMVNRFRTALQLGCWNSGQYQLKNVQAEPPAQRVSDSNFQDEVVVKPDLLFTLHLPDQNLDLVYAYEAERGTNTHAFFTKKLRAYHQFVIKQKKPRDAWRVDRVHAVLIETLNNQAATDLLPAMIHPSIRGLNLPEDGLDPDQILQQRRQNASSLFRVTHSGMFAEEELGPDRRRLPLFVRQPDVIFSDIWRRPREPFEAITLLDP